MVAAEVVPATVVATVVGGTTGKAMVVAGVPTQGLRHSSNTLRRHLERLPPPGPHLTNARRRQRPTPQRGRPPAGVVVAAVVGAAVVKTVVATVEIPQRK